MRYRSIAASLVIAGLGISSAVAMPLPSAPRSPGDIVRVDYTCGDGMHFTNAAGCVADEKAAAPAPKAHRQETRKPETRKQQVRKHKAVPARRHRIPHHPQ